MNISRIHLLKNSVKDYRLILTLCTTILTMITKALKKAKPKLSSELLLQHSDNLFDILSVWTNVSLPPDKFMSAVKEIAESFRSHASYLIKWKNSMALLRSDSNPHKDRIDTHFVMPNPTEPVPHVDIR